MTKPGDVAKPPHSASTQSPGLNGSDNEADASEHECEYFDGLDADVLAELAQEHDEAIEVAPSPEEVDREAENESEAEDQDSDEDIEQQLLEEADGAEQCVRELSEAAQMEFSGYITCDVGPWAGRLIGRLNTRPVLAPSRGPEEVYEVLPSWFKLQDADAQASRGR